MKPAAALAALFLAGLAAAQGTEPAWTQTGGDVQRSGVVRLVTDAPLDIVARYDFLAEGEQVYGGVTPALVHTPYGLMGVAFLPGAAAAGVSDVCALVRLVDPYVGSVQTIGEPVRCDGGGRVTGYSVSEDLLFACLDGLPLRGDGLLFAFEAGSGEFLWSAAPDVARAEVPGQGDLNDWFCEGAAVDDASGRVYVGYSSDFGRNRVEAVGIADGVRAWSTAVASRNFLGVNDGAAPASRAADSNLVVAAVTVTDTGVVVTGLVQAVPSGPYTLPGALPAIGGPPPASGLAWLDLDGRLVGTYVPADQPAGNDVVDNGWVGGSVWAAASGALATAVYQTGLVVVDPSSPNLRIQQFSDWEGIAGVGVAAPAWSDTHLVVPLASSVEILDAADATASRTWSDLDAGQVWSVVVSGRDAYVQTVRATGPSLKVEVFRVDLDEGKTLQRLSYETPQAGFPTAFLVPLPDGRGFLGFDATGATVVLAPAPRDRVPAAALDEDYPAAGQAVRLTLPPDGAATGYVVAWGDGVVEPAAPGETLAHAYADEIRRTLRVTALLPDGLTATQEITVHVGEPRPLELNFMQKAFAPENEEKTYAIVGLAATALGGVVALVGRTRRKTRLAAELEALERIRARGRVDPHDAVHALAEYRRALRSELASGKLDDVQFSVLDHSAVEVLHALRQRVLGPLAGRVGSEFAHRLDLALADGTIDPQEAATLGEMIAREASLSPAERAQLVALCQGFAPAGSGPTPQRTAQGP